MKPDFPVTIIMNKQEKHPFPASMFSVFPAVAGVSVLASASCFATANETAPLARTGTPRPNVLVFITDDESWLERSAYGWSNLPTPHFDRVARDGVLFARGYTSAPTCAPSRASLLTGRNFWELEEGAFIQAWLPPKFPRMPEVLATAGYHIGFTGKGWGPGVPPPGGTRRNPAGPAYDKIKYENPEPGISSVDYPANFGVFLDARPKGSPFYFWVGCEEPHTPLGPGNYKKLEQRRGLGPDKIKMPGFMPDTPETRRDRANILYEICNADDDLGRILKILEERNELENTIIIVTGDNGTQIPYSKATPYDWGVHVPLAIMWPACVPAGRRVDDFVSFADLAPTVIEAARLPIPKEMSGRSILGTLLSEKSGRVEAGRSWIVTGLEWHGEFSPASCAARAIRDERYQYIVNYGNRPPNRIPPGRAPKALLKPGEIWEEFYDCEADPWQMKNLIDSPDAGHVAAREQLKAQIRSYQLQTKDPRATGDLAIFERARTFVEQRKKADYAGVVIENGG
jgi:uncharacterized sulfatase